jgi:hypothetical protein
MSKKLQETSNKARKTLKDVGKTHIDDGDNKKNTEKMLEKHGRSQTTQQNHSALSRKH